MDQSNRYARLDLKEADLIEGGRHVLCAYVMKPKAGYGYLETAAHFAAESSTGTNVEVSTTDDFTRGVDALVYEIDPEKEIMKIAYPVELFDRNIIDGRAMLCSFLTLTIGNNQGMGDVEYAKMHDFYVPPCYLRLFDGPSMNIADMWRVLGRDVRNGGMVVGTIIKPKLGLRPKPFADACHEFWLGGDFIKNDEPQGNQTFAPLKETIRLVADAMKRAQDETGEAKLFSANITADDHYEMVARGEYILETFGENADHVAFLVDGYVTGPAAITTARRQFPRQFLHYHRAGHGAVTSPQSMRGYTAFVLSKMARLQGASGIHTGTMGYGKMEGEAADKIMAYMLTDDAAEGPFYRQDWLGLKATTPIISGGMNALRLPGFFDNLGHSNVIQTSGGGAFGHLDGGTAGAKSLRQSHEAWMAGVDLVTYAREHRELARAFESFPADADKFYPGWRDRLQRAA
ncbi:ribulose-bisphosphate carboxylase [Cereibacter johrii]|uniref:Ribulose bisphosphate carboxylase n=1 Tax=Cereibacter johrii TaxID=445629 RepID=A0ABX5JBU8_9RHOB|nr:ribulose-bisphosphate carboxylase [Cereibacter johrii]QCP87493.1 ribulose-bisphosphate carboxylase [Cereibacter sphaeroides]MEA5160458.1 ribulose-bisphosphate carboxylase [Cereibacter johrii]ODM43794.1 ribulose 1,5-bisphosphate carboxylase [Cereibacter johrii]PTM78310.1 ribulose 1,5-bisphosphate carboxylase large subunit [Cereibacter johrii]RAZ85029.1 ribulose 1,5-bisphosphate carboxylase [Cereibacter johrii]